MCVVRLQAFGLRNWATRAFGEGCGFYGTGFAFYYADNSDDPLSYHSTYLAGQRTSPTSIAAHYRRVRRYSNGT